MEQGAATRGKVAKAVVGAEAIEIKATIPNHQVGRALRRFGLTVKNDEERFIYFFDTPKLELLDAGIIARARRIVGDEHDSTVKFRPIDPADVGQKWRKFRDFKIEADASETGMVKSASFSMPVNKGVIKRVAAGKKSIAAVFSEEQEEFLAAMARRKLDFSALAVLGPLVAQRWQVKDPACPWEVTAELWRRGDGQRLMEVSIKAPVVQAAVAIGGFMAFLAEVGAEHDEKQQTKTHWALGYYAAKLARPGSAKASGAKAAQGKARKAAAAKAPAPAPARVPASRARRPPGGESARGGAGTASRRRQP